jgi:hypothetical protein
MIDIDRRTLLVGAIAAVATSIVGDQAADVSQTEAALPKVGRTFTGREIRCFDAFEDLTTPTHQLIRLDCEATAKIARGLLRRCNGRLKTRAQAEQAKQCLARMTVQIGALRWLLAYRLENQTVGYPSRSTLRSTRDEFRHAKEPLRASIQPLKRAIAEFDARGPNAPDEAEDPPIEAEIRLIALLTEMRRSALPQRA